MENYEVLSTDFDSVVINSYDPTIWSPEDLVGGEEEAYEVEEPASEEVREDIIDIVNQAEAEAEETGAEFYNGPLIRLQNYKVDNEVLGVDIQNTNYFSHVGTRERPKLDKENRADPLSVGAVLHTSDDYIVLGEKSENVEQGAGEYQLPGAGFIEDPELQYERSLNAQPSSPIHRELDEEVNLTADQLTMPQPSALVVAVHRQPMLVYDTNTTHDSDEMAEEWREMPKDEREFSELIFLPEESVDATLEGYENIRSTGKEELESRIYDGSLRPHAKGALSLL